MKIQEMTQEEYNEWLPMCLLEYAESKQKALGISDQDALDLAKQEFKLLLPQEMQTPNNFFYSYKNNNEILGSVWFKINGSQAWLCHIIIDPSIRGRGIGKILMYNTLQIIESKGAKQVGLNVFEFNTIAKNLYKSLGFEVTNVNMSKKL